MKKPDKKAPGQVLDSMLNVLSRAKQPMTVWELLHDMNYDPEKFYIEEGQLRTQLTTYTKIGLVEKHSKQPCCECMKPSTAYSITGAGRQRIAWMRPVLKSAQAS